MEDNGLELRVLIVNGVFVLLANSDSDRRRQQEHMAGKVRRAAVSHVSALCALSLLCVCSPALCSDHCLPNMRILFLANDEIPNHGAIHRLTAGGTTRAEKATPSATRSCMRRQRKRNGCLASRPKWFAAPGSLLRCSPPTHPRFGFPFHGDVHEQLLRVPIPDGTKICKQAQCKSSRVQRPEE